MEERVLNGISSFMACKVGVAPFKFLGVPVGGNPRRACMWNEVLDSVRVRLSHWRSLKLSMGGRVTLINSVLSSLPLYLFSMFKAPKKVINEIEKIQRRFLWGGDEEHKKMSWVKWTQICKPKKEGGLGVKDLYVFNLALLTKWRWRILLGNTSALWLRVLDERYGKEQPWFGNTIPVNAARKMSIWWRDLALLGEGTGLGLNWFKDVTKKRMGNGKTIKFWTDLWLGRDPLAALFPAVLESFGGSDASVADMGQWLESRWEWDWISLGAEAVFNTGNVDCNTITEFVDFMQGIQPNSRDEDRWVWLLGTPGGFTVKSCYSWMCNQLNGGASPGDALVLEACKSLWTNDFPSKVLIFCWRLLLNKLPTKDNLCRRGIISSSQQSRCVFCNEEIETADHLFCCCAVVKEIWRGVCAWLNVQVCDYDEVVLMYKGVRNMVKGKGAKRVKAIFWAATVYQVWLARNRIIFNSTSSSARSIVTSIKYVSWGWFIARRGKSSGLNFSDWSSSPMGCISML